MTEATENRGPGAALVDRWQQMLRDLKMGSDGLFQVELHCLGCGRLLNSDGNHPAEVYAGSYNGLCYGCTKKGPYTEAIAILDGCRRVSWPPSCPSHRRDRTTKYAYPGCPDCDGLGVASYETSVGGSRYGVQCKSCMARFSEHPLRVRAWDWQRKVMEHGNAVYRAALLRAAGVPGRASYKRECEALEAISAEARTRIAAPIQSRALHLLALARARSARDQVNVWLPPALWTTEKDWAA